MKLFDSSKISMALIGFVIVVLGGGGSANAEFTFGSPANLGPNVNSSSNDAGPSIAADGLSLFFDSDRPGGSGSNDLWVATRKAIDEDWGEPVNLGPIMNTEYEEFDSSISADGLSLLFASDHPGGSGDFDLWVARRNTTDEDWGVPVNLGPIVNSEYEDYGPGISADGLSLYFSSNRPGTYGGPDLWVTMRTTVNDAWGEPVNLGPTVNSSLWEARPKLSTDGLTLLFGSNQLDGGDLTDIYMTTRETTQSAWGTPVKLGSSVNSPDDEDWPCISTDGRTLLFESDRPGGSGAWDIWQVSIEPVVDFNGDRKVDFKDFCKLAQYWFQAESSVDIAPAPLGDGKIAHKDLAVFSEHWLEEYPEIIYIQWLGHASVKIWAADVVVYVDPRRLSDSPHDATLVLVTHTHGDHYSPGDIANVSGPQTQFIAPPDVVQQYGKGQPIAPRQTIQLDGVSVTSVPAYNTNKPNHPKSRNWVGFVIELGLKRIYVAGDTDLTEEMKALTDIDAAILPAGGTYTMNAVEAAEATQYIKPELAIPYHWGQNVGNLSDAETFAQKAACAVKIMTVGETISSDNWPEYSPLIAHWKLDETEGSIAYDSAGDNSGTLNGNPLWRPAGGKVDGALEFDGTDDYVSADFVLNPADGPFSVFAWIKGGAPGQAVISQTDGVNWLSADASAGNLMTELRHIAGRVVGPPLWSQTVITDGDWHRVGFVWDGSYRILYADGVEVATDAQTGLGSSDGGLYIGTGKGLGPATFFFGLIDDVGIYNQALSAAEIAALAR